MLRSMTGFGRASGTVAGFEVEIQVRCLNHRYREVRVTVPPGLGEIEIPLWRKVHAWIERGRADCTVRVTPGGGSPLKPRLDEVVARQYLEAYRQLAQVVWKETGREEVPTLSMLVAAEGVVTNEAPHVEFDRLWSEFEAVLAGALEQADRMRRDEGARLEKVLRKQHERIAELAGKLRAMAPAEGKALAERAAERIAQLSASAEIDQQRLAQEMAILAERCDVTEELDRISSHLVQWRKFLDSEQPVGRKMDFLMQEFNREVNTLASKSQSASMNGLAVELKAEIEKAREQIQNIL